eukprot:s6151_g1.t1
MRECSKERVAFHGSGAGYLSCQLFLQAAGARVDRPGKGSFTEPTTELEIPAKTAAEDEASRKEEARALRLDILESQLKDLQMRVGVLEEDSLKRKARRRGERREPSQGRAGREEKAPDREGKKLRQETPSKEPTPGRESS